MVVWSTTARGAQGSAAPSGVSEVMNLPSISTRSSLFDELVNHFSSITETARFYRALSMLGTDFSLMETLFPRRTRFELKRKFKLEEKVNHVLIDKTISTQKPFDETVFGDESGESFGLP